MTDDPPRLKDATGPITRLLRSADLDTPPSSSRQRAVAFATAAMTLTTTTAAAAGTGALKSVLVSLCVGALGGGTLALVASQLSTPAEHRATPATSSRPASVSGTAVPSPVPTMATPVSSQGNAPKLSPLIPFREHDPRSPPDPPAALPAPSTGAFAPDTTAQPNLADEQRLIEAARAAVAAGAVARALTLLDTHDRTYPRGHFHPESLALRIQALAQAGDTARARTLATEFRKRYPQHPLLRRVLAATGE